MKLLNNFTHPDFDKNRTFACNLHLYHSRNSFSYMVTNMAKSQCLLFKSFRVDESQPFLHELALEHEEISRFYRSASLMPANTPFCLVPGSVFAERHAAEYYRLSFDLSLDETVLSAEFDKAHITAVMGMNLELWKHYKNFFQSFKVQSESSHLYDWMLSAARSREESAAAIMLYPEHFILVLNRKGEMQLGNRYPMANSEELLYFLVNACEQLKVDPSQLNVYLAGEPSKIIDMKGFITPYVNQVLEAQLSTDADFSLISDNELQQRFFTFLQSVQCE